LSKNKSEKPQREVTKRQLSHWQRESRLQHIVTIIGAIIIVAILVIVGTGLYLDKYKPFHTTVIKVGDTEYSMDYYIDYLALIAKSNPQYIQYYTDFVTRQIEQSQMITEEAAKIGITVSDDEVNKYVTENKLSNSKAQFDAAHYELLIKKLQSDYFDKQIGPVEQRALLAMFLESQTKLNEVKARLDKGEKFSDLAGELSLETKSKENKGDFGWIPQGVLSTTLGVTTDTVLDDAVFGSSVVQGVFNQVVDDNQTKNMGYWVLKVTETRPATNEVHLFAMLFGNQEDANSMVAILSTGADWVTEAKSHSVFGNATADGGDLDFVTKGKMGDAVDAVIFPSDPTKALPLNTVSAVVPDTVQPTKGGVWLYQVTGINPSKEITGDNRITLVNQKLDAWALKVWNDNQSRVTNMLSPEQTDFAVTKALSR
jgi:parvulin-like peptidyl-prolyl isomerase